LFKKNKVEALKYKERKKNKQNIALPPVAKFIVPGWGDKVNSGIGLSPGPTGYIGWRTGTTTLSRSQLYTPVRDFEFVYKLRVMIDVL
jgi:hypothetical protein